MLKADAIFARKTLELHLYLKCHSSTGVWKGDENGRIFVVSKSKIRILERMKKG